MQLQKCAKKRAALTSTILFLAGSRVTHKATRTRVRCKTEMHITRVSCETHGEESHCSELLLLELDTYTDRVSQSVSQQVRYYSSWELDNLETDWQLKVGVKSE